MLSSAIVAAADTRGCRDSFALGPVLGEIKHRSGGTCSVVVMFTPLEDTCVRITATLVSAADSVVVATDGNQVCRMAVVEKVRCVAMRPSRAVLTGLRSNATYAIEYRVGTIGPSARWPVGHVHRARTSAAALAVFVSCDFPEMDARTCMWDDVGESRPDIVVHLGDNIYADLVHKRATRALAASASLLATNAPRVGNHRAAREAVADAYAERYAETWSQWTGLLADASHIMIPDDHDVTNDFTSEGIADSDDHPEATRIALHQLRRHQHALAVDKDIVTARDGRVYTMLSPTCMLAACPRVHMAHPPVNTDMLDQILSAADAVGATRLVLSLASSPVPDVTNTLAGRAYEAIFGLDGLWTPDQQRLMYDALFAWLDAGQGRAVTIIGGDIHIGCRATVTRRASSAARRGFASIELWATGPITNQPTPVEWMYARALRGVHAVPGGYSVEVHEARARRNYLRMDVLAHTCELVWSPHSFLGSIARMLRFTWQLWRA